jgi:hypothetical protein
MIAILDAGRVAPAAHASPARLVEIRTSQFYRARTGLAGAPEMVSRPAACQHCARPARPA